MRPRKERIVNNFLTVTVYAHYRFIDTARIVYEACRVYETVELLSVRPSVTPSVCPIYRQQ